MKEPLNAKLVQEVARIMDWSKPKTYLILADFQDIHGQSAVADMKAFLDYADHPETDLSVNQIKMTIAHDLGGRHDKLMLPRTDGYTKHLNQLIEQTNGKNI